MFALLAGTAGAQQYLFQMPVGYAPTQQLAGVTQMGDYAVLPYEQSAMLPQQYYVPEAAAYVQEETAWIPAPAQDDGSDSWSFLALCAVVGAGVGTAASRMLSSSSAPAESDLEAGIYNQRVAMLAAGGQEAVLSETSSRILEDLKSMTLLEASELVKAIEETFGVDASAAAGPAMMMAAPGAAPAEAAEEQTEFTVMLDSFPADKKIAVLKVVRNATGLGLKEAKELVEAAPKEIKEGIPKAAAEEMKKEIEDAGGVVSIK